MQVHSPPFFVGSSERIPYTKSNSNSSFTFSASSWCFCLSFLYSPLIFSVSFIFSACPCSNDNNSICFVRFFTIPFRYIKKSHLPHSAFFTNTHLIPPQDSSRKETCIIPHTLSHSWPDSHWATWQNFCKYTSGFIHQRHTFTIWPPLGTSNKINPPSAPIASKYLWHQPTNYLQHHQHALVFCRRHYWTSLHVCLHGKLRENRGRCFSQTSIMWQRLTNWHFFRCRSRRLKVCFLQERRGR